MRNSYNSTATHKQIKIKKKMGKGPEIDLSKKTYKD